MDSEDFKLQLAKLSSTNYRFWSTTIKLVLASNDLVRYIESSFNDLIDGKTQELSPSSATPEVVVTTIEATGNKATSPSALSTSLPALHPQLCLQCPEGNRYCHGCPQAWERQSDGVDCCLCWN